MKPTVGCCVLVVVSGVAMALQVGVQAQGNAAAAEREVRATIDRCLSAYGANDLDPYFACFADDMTLWRGDRGRFWQPSAKKVYMEGQADFVKQSGGYQSCTPIDVTVQMSPAADSAVATYELDCLLKPRADGQQRKIDYENTIVLFKRGSDWKIVHFNWHLKAQPAAAGNR